MGRKQIGGGHGSLQSARVKMIVRSERLGRRRRARGAKPLDDGGDTVTQTGRSVIGSDDSFDHEGTVADCKIALAGALTGRRSMSQNAMACVSMSAGT